MAERVSTLNGGTMTGKKRELTDMMEKVKTEDYGEGKQGQKHWRWIQTFLTWCRWEEKRSRNHFEGRLCEQGCKGEESARQDHAFETRNQRGNVECVYAPKVGQLEEKEEFWSKLDLVVECSHGGETDKRFTGHVGARNREHEVLGRYGVRKEMWKGSG